MAFKDTQFWKAIVVAWKWFLNFTQFLDSPAGANGVSKFSMKRLMAAASFVTSVIFAFKDAWVLALIYFAGAVILGIVCAITKT